MMAVTDSGVEELVLDVDRLLCELPDDVELLLDVDELDEVDEELLEVLLELLEVDEELLEVLLELLEVDEELLEVLLELLDDVEELVEVELEEVLDELDVLELELGEVELLDGELENEDSSSSPSIVRTTSLMMYAITLCPPTRVAHIQVMLFLLHSTPTQQQHSFHMLIQSST